MTRLRPCGSWRLELAGSLLVTGVVWVLSLLVDGRARRV